MQKRDFMLLQLSQLKTGLKTPIALYFAGAKASSTLPGSP